MKGDEDLGQDIQMKGQPFHYAQWNPVVVNTKPGERPLCHGTNGPDGVNCARETCSGTNGPKDGESGTPCEQVEPAAIPHYNTDPEAGRPYTTTGDLSHTRPVNAPPMQALVGVTFDPKYDFSYEKGQAEGVHVLQTKHARSHTTFY
jgi:hypothetical protein